MRLTRVATIAALSWFAGELGWARRACADAPSASGVPGPRFGDPGQVSPNIDIETVISPFVQVFPYASTTSFTTRPGADLFVLPNVSVGAEVMYDVRHSETFLYSPSPFGTASSVSITSRNPFVDTRKTTIGAALRAGYNWRISNVLSLWPRMGIGVWAAKVRFGGLPVTSLDPNARSFDYDETSLYTHFAIPFLVHVAPHCYVGLGFDVWTDFSSHPLREFGYGLVGDDGSSRTSVHGSSTIGGWF